MDIMSSEGRSEVFDYVVVGGGTAGCVIAARLSEDPTVSVCLLEAGASDVDEPAILRLVDWMALLEPGSVYDWGYTAEPQERGNAQLQYPRARVLGGCSSHNTCVAFWPLREDLDAWSEAGSVGWSYEECEPLLRRIESNDGAWEGHGRSGPVEVMTIPPRDPCAIALLEAAAAEGLPTRSFNEGVTIRDGAGFFQINCRPDGVRASASVSYLHPVLGTRSNLEVRTGAWVSRIVLEGTRAVGARYRRDGGTSPETVFAAREVILSAGAIDTPKLLMLSGIGPADHLRDMGIDVVLDAPGVGTNLMDHVEAVVMWQAARPMTRTSTQWSEVGLFARTAPGLDRPDVMIHYSGVPLDQYSAVHGYPTTDNAFCLAPNVTHGRSRGTVRLRSPDFRDSPRIDPRYFTDPENHDMEVMIRGLRLARRVASRPALSDWVGPELSPGPDVVAAHELAEYVTATHNTVYHPAGSARMGPRPDDGAVVDAQLRVHGVAGLRIADASVMPSLTTVNPNLTCLMIGEKCARLVSDLAR